MSDGEYYAKIAQSEAGETAIVFVDQGCRNDGTTGTRFQDN